MAIDKFGFNTPYTIDRVWNEITFISESEFDGLTYEESIKKLTEVFHYHLKRTKLSDCKNFARNYVENMI